MRRRTVLLLAGVGAVVVGVPLGAYGLVALSNRNAPEPAALGAPPEASGGGRATAEGTWVVADAATNFFGYRVRERLGPVAAPSDAVARTDQVEGTAILRAGELTALDVTVDLASLTSDSPRRDDFVSGEALDVDEFPTGELHLVDAVEIEAFDPAEPHDVVELAVPAELTLRGETHEIVFDVQARWNGPTIQAAGSTEIQRSDYGIDVSSRAGFNIAEEGTIEFELTFASEQAAIGTSPPTLIDNPATISDEGEFLPPCQSDDTELRLDRPVLVTGSGLDGDSTNVELVSGAQQVAPVVISHGLTGGAAWSPDGSQIVYSSSTNVEDPRTLSVVAATGGVPTPLPGLSDATHPDWGPDGRIVFVQHTGGDHSDIWVVEPDGSGARVLAETPGLDTDPRWSPDGESVVFVTVDGEQNQDVVVVGSDGRGLRALVGTPAYEYAPSFTPDGREVLFVRDGSIFAVGVDGDDERQLTDGPSDANPEMSSDGRRLAFLRMGSLYVAAPDGSQPACVVTNQAIGGGPRWHPGH
jgi:polyisoprenoid-binding protein YceI